MKIVHICMTIKTKNYYLLNKQKNHGGGVKREKLYIKQPSKLQTIIIFSIMKTDSKISINKNLYL